MKIFAERLKELRLEKNISVLQLSKELKVSDTTVGRWEKATIIPNIEHLRNIAVYFGVTTDYLVGLED